MIHVGVRSLVILLCDIQSQHVNKITTHTKQLLKTVFFKDMVHFRLVTQSRRYTAMKTIIHNVTKMPSFCGYPLVFLTWIAKQR